MNVLLDKIKQTRPEQLSYEWLGEFVHTIDIASLDYKSFLPELPKTGGYSRHILCLEPFECVLLHWQPGAESAVHHHEGFWGYVLCLEGEIENITYKHEDGELLESKGMRALPGGVIDEPDGVIHKIVNSRKDQPLITLHFYYPALETLDGLKLYDLANRRLAELNEKAATASFDQDEACFRSIKEDAFEFVPAGARVTSKTHRIFPVVPKPDSKTISALVSRYYREQAEEYDYFDLMHESRRQYNERINLLIAARLQKKASLNRLVDLACGTGRRAIEIREMAQRDYHLCGIDLSPDMVAVAASRGMEVRTGNWLDIEIPENYADAVSFLYAYGHIPTVAERRASLKKIYRTLKPGGLFFFDVFNVRDRSEWGPLAVKAFEEQKLERFGYERGDVFYRKIGGEGIAFLHYCEEERLVDLLTETGLIVDEVLHVGYVQQSGEILDSENGSLFIVARRPE